MSELENKKMVRMVMEIILPKVFKFKRTEAVRKRPAMYIGI